ncbi:MAG: MBL fold metallo-hydrolase [Cocleimonas sp.]|nr:MBL fold metallo-hydrolase [Cocleimonas sp.]
MKSIGEFIMVGRFNIAFFSVLCGFLLIANAIAKAPSNDILSGYETTKIAEHTWYIAGPLATPNVANKGFMNNPAFTITDKSVIVFDPGSSVLVGRALIKRIRQLTKNPITHVFNTHIHGDHWLGNQAFINENATVKLYAHPDMIRLAKNGEAKVWIDMMMDRTEGITKETVAAIPTENLKDQHIIKIDNISVKAHLNKKAHTITDAMFEIIEDKVLITGDNAFRQRAPRLDDGSYLGNIAVMESALKLPVEVIVPGHGAVGGKTILSDYKDFISIIYNTTKQLKDEDDLEPHEIKPKVIEKMSKYKDWTGFDKALGKLIGVAALEVEANDF